jgi:hypothetical protein
MGTAGPQTCNGFDRSGSVSDEPAGRLTATTQNAGHEGAPDSRDFPRVCPESLQGQADFSPKIGEGAV